MLNRKKNYTWVYVLIVVALGVLLWGASQDMPFNEETVSEPIANTFAK
ncbi:MAG: hypothetical protein J6Y53_03120 [Alphaproteobacteria bacterium]|nr:hypothetical protein [Alphaproteobacteria bacterium]